MYERFPILKAPWVPYDRHIRFLQDTRRQCGAYGPAAARGPGSHSPYICNTAGTDVIGSAQRVTSHPEKTVQSDPRRANMLKNKAHRTAHAAQITAND